MSHNPSSSEDHIDIIHFNDVYHIEERNIEPIGGAARFKGELDRLYEKLSRTSSNQEKVTSPLVLFSGDAFNPSTQSTITKGSHMVPVLNHLRIDVACYGNHDFDFGVPVLEDLAGQCNFPWLLSNISVNQENLDTPLAKAKRYYILNRGNLKIGVIGLVEKEWLLTIASLPPDYHYMDFVQVGTTLSKELREEHNVDIVIALTHMRLPNDEILAQQCEKEIDLILGGHDHFFHVGSGCDFVDEKGEPTEAPSQSQDRSIPNLRVVKSGTDFRTLSHIRLTKARDVSVCRYRVTNDSPSNSDVAKLVEETQAQISDKLQVVIGYRKNEWDTRSEAVRLGESGFGNFLADIFLNYYPDADVALLCGGALRSDTVYPPGEVTLGDILAILPFDDPVVVLSLAGGDLFEALESSVSMYPKQEGRFPQLAGMKITFDPKAEPGNRLTEVLVADHDSVYVPLDRNKTYTVVTRDYMALGFDGFDALKKGKYIVDEENGIMASTLMRRFFLGLKYSALLAAKVQSSPLKAAFSAACKWRRKALVGKDLPTFGQCICSSAICPSDEMASNQDPSHPCSDISFRPFLTVEAKLEGRICQK
ncbi:hypothetical protein DSO57_1026095 [Entomophthora muscae]|uniref:Uncharacterized protein n=1 Tax=Entomophthora muscae TaxID=34485 RepID=A0ACC2S419_9FUNG|nr:hypothetical protein DSO57_1026095 [Entomophthora muscae]